MQGRLSIHSGGGQMNINQLSQLGIVDWKSFSVGAGESLNIKQPGADATLVNRVVGADPSRLLGQIHANGRVYLINPNGVLVGRGARIDTAAFIASTLDVADSELLKNSTLDFSGKSPASVVNLGTIKAADGDAILIAQVVNNAGTIKAPKGVAGLAAGSQVVFQPSGNQHILIKAGDFRKTAGTGAANTGMIQAAQAELKAAGGSAYDLAINQSGIIRATGVAHKNGRVLLVSQGGNIQDSGAISAVNKDGAGGTVLIGGGAHGADAAIPNARGVTVSRPARIDVSSRVAGKNAGQVVVWSDGQTSFSGRIDGQAAAAAGANVEVSGKHRLNYTGQADLSGAAGKTGTLLLDPANAVISTATDDQANGVFNNTVLDKNLSSANVVVDASSYGTYGDTTTGQIDVNAPVSWSSGNSLTLKADNNIDINANMNGPGAVITLLAVEGSGSLQSTSSPTVSVALASAATITADTLSIGQNPDATYADGANKPTQAFLRLGDINLLGAVKVNTLDLRLQNAGIGDTTATNSGNAIGSLTTSVTGGAFRTIKIANGSGNLSIAGNFGDASIGDGVTLSTPGTLTLAAGAKVTSGANTNLVLASTGGSFINNAGSSAVMAPTSGRYLIYSNDPAKTTKGGLTGAPVYDKTYAANAPSTITETGNRFLYSLAPTLTFTAENFTRSVNTVNPTLTYSVSGLVGGDALSNAVSGQPLLSTTATTSSSIGTYPVSITQGKLVASDYGYKLAFKAGTLTVSPSDYLNITADNKTRRYGDANPAFTYTATGFVNGDTASILNGFTVNFATTAALNSPVGTYSITPSGASTLNNYGVDYHAGTLTIDPRLLTITADNKSIDYLDSKPGYTATWTGLASFDTQADVPGLTFSDNAGSSPGAGTYTITPSGAANRNYTITFKTGTLTVNPRPITVVVQSKSRVYGDGNPSFDALFYGLPSSYGTAGNGLNTLTFSTQATPSSNVGTYAINAAGMSANFQTTYKPGTLTVTPAALTVTANDQSREYGDPNPTFTGTYRGLKLNDTISNAVSGLQYTTSATQGSDVGYYSIIPTGTASPDYNVNFQSGTLTITKAPISLIAPNPVSRPYGDANPAFTFHVVGLKNGDSVAGKIQVAAVTTAIANSPVGDYGITIQSTISPDYSIPASAYAPGTLTVTARPLTITAPDVNRQYGDPNPVFTASFSGLASFDTASVISGIRFHAPTRVAPAGSYNGDITVTSNPDPNYAITYVPGNMTITPAPITVYSQSLSRTYGDTNPTFSVSSVSGLKLGQSPGVLGATVKADATPNTSVGVYGLSASLATGNYRVAKIEGALTIQPRPLSVGVNVFSRQYGDATAPQDSVLNVTGLLPGDPVTSVLAVSSPARQFSQVGGYPINVTTKSGNYYLAGSVDGADKLQIIPRVIGVSLTGTFSRQYYQANPNFNSGLSVTNAFDSAANIVQVNAPGRDQRVGNYGLTVSVKNADYQIGQISNTASLTIRPLFIAATLSGTFQYDAIAGGPEPDFYKGISVTSPRYPLPDPVSDIFSVTGATGHGQATAVYGLGLAIKNANYRSNAASLASTASLQVNGIGPAPYNADIASTSKSVVKKTITVTVQPRIQVYRAGRYAGHLGLWFSDFPNQSMAALKHYLADSGPGLLTAITGKKGAKASDVTDAMLRAYINTLKPVPAPPAGANQAELRRYWQAVKTHEKDIGALSGFLVAMMDDLSHRDRSKNGLSGVSFAVSNLYYSLESKLRQNRNQLVSDIEAQKAQWEKQERAKNATGGNLLGMLGDEVPYQSFFENGLKDYVAKKKAGYVAAASMVAATAVGKVVDNTSAGKALDDAVFVNRTDISGDSESAIMGDSAESGSAAGDAGAGAGDAGAGIADASGGIADAGAEGGSALLDLLGSGAADTVIAGMTGLATAGAAVAGVAFGLAVGITRGVELAKNAQVEKVYNGLADQLKDGYSVDKVVDFSTAKQSGTNAITSSINRAASRMAIMDFMIGSSK